MPRGSSANSCARVSCRFDPGYRRTSPVHVDRCHNNVYVAVCRNSSRLPPVEWICGIAILPLHCAAEEACMSIIVNTATPLLHPTSQETFFASPRGQLCIRTVCSPEFLHTLTLEEGIGRFARYRSIISGVSTLEKVAVLPDANVTVTLSPERRIIGYIECSYP